MLVAVRVDSLRQAAALATTEAGQWRRAATGYRSAADSLQVALAMSESRRINQEAVTKVWRVRARRRGALVWLGAVATGGVGYLLIFR